MIIIISTLTQSLIILTAVLVGAIAILLFLSAYKLFFKAFSAYSSAQIHRGSDTKASSNPQAQRALEEFEASKMLFFTRKVSGSVFFLPPDAWAKKPQILSLPDDMQIRTAYFFNASDYAENTEYNAKPAEGTGTEKLVSDKWAIVLHGHKGCGLDNTKLAYQFLKRGFNVISPDLSGHGADRSKYVSYGYTDRLIIKKWIDYILALQSSAKIVLHGVSMGAFAALQSIGEDLPSNVKCVISDCGFVSVSQELKAQTKNRPKFLANIILSIIHLYARIFLGYNLKDTSVKSVLQSNTKVPILFFHGEKDKVITVDRAHTLHKACSAESKLVCYPNAAHAESMLLNFDDYWQITDSFLERNLNR